MRRMTAQIAATAASPWGGAVWRSVRFSGIGSVRRLPWFAGRAGVDGRATPDRDLLPSPSRRDDDAPVLPPLVLDLHHRYPADLAGARDMRTATGLQVHLRLALADAHQPQPPGAAW